MKNSEIRLKFEHISVCIKLREDHISGFVNSYSGVSFTHFWGFLRYYDKTFFV